LAADDGTLVGKRAPLLDPVERVSEMLFGLFMALSFVGAISVATAGSEDIRTLFISALGCNLAWGLVDGVMYVIACVILRGRTYTLALSVRAADAPSGRNLIAQAMSPALTTLVSADEIEAVRTRLLAQPAPERPSLQRDDLLGGLGIFLLCVVATFPVVLPFMLIGDVALAKTVSRGLALAMLFLGGFALGRYAGYGSWKAGFILMITGTLLVAAIMALGG